MTNMTPLKAPALQIQKLRVGDHFVYLEDLGPNQGKVIVTSNSGQSWSYYWGAMGGDLKEFLCRINGDYFANNLIVAGNRGQLDVKRTFTEVRRFIREDLGVTYFKYKAFETDVRTRLRLFQQLCEEYPSKETFVTGFRSQFVDLLDFYLIGERSAEARMEREFKGLHEPWNFLVTKPSQEYKNLKRLHGRLVKALQQNKNTSQKQAP